MKQKRTNRKTEVKDDLKGAARLEKDIEELGMALAKIVYKRDLRVGSNMSESEIEESWELMGYYDCLSDGPCDISSEVRTCVNSNGSDDDLRSYLDQVFESAHFSAEMEIELNKIKLKARDRVRKWFYQSLYGKNAEEQSSLSRDFENNFSEKLDDALFRDKSGCHEWAWLLKDVYSDDEAKTNTQEADRPD